MRAIVILSILSCAPVALPAQAARVATAADSVPASIQEAELQGSRFPRAQSDSTGGLFRALAGTQPATRRCVAGTEDARSGEFIARGMWLYENVWPQGGSKIFWLPAHPSAGSAEGLVVRAKRLDASVDALVFLQPHLTTTGSGDGGYPSGFRLPSPGNWLLVATAGSDWGCFILRFR